MAATMSTTAALPASRFTPGPDCLGSIFLENLEGQSPLPEKGCLPSTHGAECPIYWMGSNSNHYNRLEAPTSCYPNPTEAVQGCPSGYTTACAESTVTPPYFYTGYSTLNWPVTEVDAVCCPTNMQFHCTFMSGYRSTTCVAPVTQDAVVSLYTYTYYAIDPPAPITAPSGEIPFAATKTFGKQTVPGAATLRAGQDYVWASAIRVEERVYGTSVVWKPGADRVPPPAVQTQQRWAPGGNPRRTGIAALCLVLGVSVLFLSSVFGFWRKRRTLKQRRADRDIHGGNWTTGPEGSSGSVRSRNTVTGGARNWTTGSLGSSPVRSQTRLTGGERNWTTDPPVSQNPVRSRT